MDDVAAGRIHRPVRTQDGPLEIASTRKRSKFARYRTEQRTGGKTYANSYSRDYCRAGARSPSRNGATPQPLQASKPRRVHRDADKGLKTSEQEQMQRDADKGARPHYGESGYVADQDKPGRFCNSSRVRKLDRPRVQTAETLAVAHARVGQPDCCAEA